MPEVIDGIRFEIPCNIEDERSDVTVGNLIEFLSKLDQNLPVYWDSPNNRRFVMVAPEPPKMNLFLFEAVSDLPVWDGA